MAVDRRTVKLLTYWGQWAAQGVGIPRCNTNMEAVELALIPGSGSSESPITDDHAMLVDAAVSSLMSRNPEMGYVLSRYYRSADPSIRAVAKSLEMPKTRAASLLSTAEAWVEGALSDKLYLEA